MLKLPLAIMLLCMFGFPAFAQTQSPEVLAHQIDDAVWGMAQRITQLEHELVKDEQEIAKGRDRIKELENKYESKKGGEDK